MTALDYQLPTTPSARSGSLMPLGLVSVVVALLVAPLPVAVLFDMNRECVRVASRGYEFPGRYPVARPKYVPVAAQTYSRVRNRAVLTLVGPLTLLAAAVVAVRSRAWGIRLHLAYVAVHVAALAALVIAARQFSTELVRPYQGAGLLAFYSPGSSSVGDTSLRVAVFSMAYPVALAIVFRRRLHDRLPWLGRAATSAGAVWRALQSPRAHGITVTGVVVIGVTVACAVPLIAFRFVHWLLDW